MATHTDAAIKAQALILLAGDGYPDPNAMVLPFTSATQVKTPLGLCLSTSSAAPLWTFYTALATSVLDAAANVQSA